MKKAGRGVVGGAVLLGAGIAGAGGAAAQCVDSSPFNLAQIIPFASGSGISSYISALGAVNSSSLAQSTAFVGVPGNPDKDQQGGGVWVRGISGTVETQSNTTTISNVVGFGGTINCQTTTKQDFNGAQIGMDLGRFNFGAGTNFHFGATAGYFDISAKDRTPGEGFFSGDFQVPFAGLYAALSAGNFAFDTQVRGDFIQSKLTDPSQGVSRQELDARSFAFLWNASYRHDFANNWFIEPSVGGVWSRTEIDPFNVAGNIVAATVKIDDVESLLGRASLRVGTTIVNGGVAWLPFATVSLFHEFAGNVVTNINTEGGIGAATSSTSRVGTYVHAGLGIAGLLIDTGWLGYARIDYRSGEDIEGISVNAGMRYQFTPAKGLAAGLKDDPNPRQVQAYNWTGLYAGGIAGGLRGREDWTSATFGTQVDPSYAGYLLGGQAGYNHQVGNIVLGLEIDYGGSNADGGKSCPNAFFFTCTAEVRSLGLITGRLGYASERALIYAKAGLAIADVTAGTSFNIPGAAPGVFKSSDSLSGWAWGGGMEYALTDRWSAKAEYIHFELDRAVLTIDGSGAGDVNVVTKGDTVRVGVNYHFGK